MKLSVIIVNYNVKHFLEQCLHSVVRASKNIPAEIFVVDNNSVDGSTQLIKEKFPRVFLIENIDNLGFAKANNQAIKIAKGEYILLLNPDTVVEEDTFSKIINFMEDHPEAGALGVKMIDGKGNFLPESKRGLPTPWVAFCKMFGLAKIFPRSKRFAGYHLSFLDKNEIHPVDVLAGAFMLIRKKTLDETGLLDESFFMYGEDIDLSYRITQKGYINYYFPGTTIIHYKGESTRKGSLNYVKVFYMAMIIFAKKHFSGGKVSLFSFLIHLAIWFHASLSVIGRIINRLLLPFLDALVIFSGYLFLTPLWEYIRYEPDYYPPEFISIVVPVYIIFWISAILISGGYKKPVSLFNVARGILWGSLSILLVYSLASESYRFSRALILMGSAWAAFALIFYRLLFHLMKFKSLGFCLKKTKKIAIAGHLNEAVRVKNLLGQTQVRSELAGFIAVDNTDKHELYIGSLHQLNEIVRINRVDEIIFCAENMSSSEIIKAMLDLTTLDIDFKIAPPKSISIIGSNSIHTAGDLYVVHINAISRPENRYRKRVLDIGAVIFLFLLSPFIIWYYKNKRQFIRNITDVVTGRKSWVGYSCKNQTNQNLPSLRPGILSPAGMFNIEEDDYVKREQLDILYARDYQMLTDSEIILKGWKNLDKQ